VDRKQGVLESIPSTDLPMATPIDLDTLFNAKGLVALVTGGGTGELFLDERRHVIIWY